MGINGASSSENERLDLLIVRSGHSALFKRPLWKGSIINIPLVECSWWSILRYRQCFIVMLFSVCVRGTFARALAVFIVNCMCFCRQARGCVRACRVFWVNTARPAAGLLPRLRCEESLVPGMGSLITLIRAEAVGWHPKAVTGARSALFCSALLYSAILSSVLLRPRAQIVGADIESEHMSSHCFSLWRWLLWQLVTILLISVFSLLFYVDANSPKMLAFFFSYGSIAFALIFTVDDRYLSSLLCQSHFNIAFWV